LVETAQRKSQGIFRALVAGNNQHLMRRSIKMKKCNFCGQDIPELARKCFHCQSYQNPADAPKASFDLATLVISFIGVSASIAIIAAGVFSYFGYKNISEISDRSNKILDDTKKIADKYDEKLKAISSAENDFNKVKTDLDAIFIRQQFGIFQQIMDSLILDELHKTHDLIELLNEVANSTKEIGNLKDVLKVIQMKIDLTTKSIVFYKDKDFISVITVLSPLSDSIIYKHRLLYACYHNLVDDAIKANNLQDKNKYIEMSRHHAGEAYKIGTKVNKSNLSSKVNFAMSLLLSDSQDDIDNAKKLLLEARKDAPLVPAISYNIAIYYAKVKKFNDCLDYLDESKAHGGFSNEQDIKFFINDIAFSNLRNEATKNPLYQNRLNTLLTLPH
jgi:hypothetical protein